MKIKREHLRGGQVWRYQHKQVSNYAREIKIMGFAMFQEGEGGMTEEIVKVKENGVYRWQIVRHLLSLMDKQSPQWRQVTRGEMALEKLRK